ncbi:MAG: TrgA family protein [Rhodobacterales bacterium]|nr:TrgA family protein [Rhodobacterales bacterium]NCO16331.1 TrgA family protein [Alphaproteobacteria bacterium]
MAEGAKSWRRPLRRGGRGARLAAALLFQPSQRFAMPTAAKLVAALLFAAMGYLAAEAFKPTMPEGTRFGYFSLICAALGLACGWQVMGKLAGRGYGAAITSGIQTAATFAAFALLGFCIYLMITRALDHRYGHDVVKALLAVFALMLENGARMLAPPVLGTLLAGAVVGGVATEWVAKRWR